MSDDEEDVVADASGMEPEASLADLRANDGARGGDGGDDRDEDEPAIVGGGPEGGVVKRNRHVISDKTRELFKKASAAVKAQLEADGDESPFGEYEEGVASLKAKATAPAQPKEGAAAPAPGQPDQPAAKVQEAAAPAQPSAEEQASRAALEARVADLDAREQRLAELEAARDMGRVKTAYFEKGGSVIASQIREWLGKDVSDDDYKQEVADLITELSVSVLGVNDVPSEVKRGIEARRALRSVKVLKESITETEAQKAKRQEQEQQEQGKRAAIHALNQELRTPTKDYAKQFPALFAEDDPGLLIYLTAERQQKQDGTILAWTEAAKRADAHLRKQASAFYDKRKHLFDAAPANAGAPTGGQRERVQGDPQGIRRSHTLTESATGATTIQTPPKPDVPAKGGWSREAHRAQTRQKFRAAFRAEPDE